MSITANYSTYNSITAFQQGSLGNNNTIKETNSSVGSSYEPVYVDEDVQRFDADSYRQKYGDRWKKYASSVRDVPQPDGTIIREYVIEDPSLLEQLSEDDELNLEVSGLGELVNRTHLDKSTTSMNSSTNTINPNSMGRDASRESGVQSPKIFHFNPIQSGPNGGGNNGADGQYLNYSNEYQSNVNNASSTSLNVQKQQQQQQSHENSNTKAMQMQQQPSMKKSANPNNYNSYNNGNFEGNYASQQQQHKHEQQMGNGVGPAYNHYSGEYNQNGNIERESSSEHPQNRKLDKYFQPIGMSMSNKSAGAMMGLASSKSLKDEDEVDKEVEIIHEQGQQLKQYEQAFRNMEPPSGTANDSVVEYEILDEHGNQIMINGAEQLKQLAACVNEVRQSDGSVIKEYILNDPKIIEQIRSQIKTLGTANNQPVVSHTPPLPPPSSATGPMQPGVGIDISVHNGAGGSGLNSGNSSGHQQQTPQSSNNNNNNNMNGGHHYGGGGMSQSGYPNSNGGGNHHTLVPPKVQVNGVNSIMPTGNGGPSSHQHQMNAMNEHEAAAVRQHHNHMSQQNQQNMLKTETKLIEQSSSSPSLNNNQYVSQVQQQIQKFQKQHQQQQQQHHPKKTSGNGTPSGNEPAASQHHAGPVPSGLVSKFTETFSSTATETSAAPKSRAQFSAAQASSQANNQTKLSASNSNGSNKQLNSSGFNMQSLAPPTNARKFELKTSKGKSLQFTITGGDPSESDIEEVNNMLNKRNLNGSGLNSRDASYKESNFFNNGLRAVVVTPANGNHSPSPLVNSKSSINLTGLGASNASGTKLNKPKELTVPTPSEMVTSSSSAAGASSSFQPRSLSNFNPQTTNHGGGHGHGHHHHHHQLSKSGSINNMLAQSGFPQPSAGGFLNTSNVMNSTPKFNSGSSNNVNAMNTGGGPSAAFYQSPYHFEQNKSQPNLNQMSEFSGSTGFLTPHNNLMRQMLNGNGGGGGGGTNSNGESVYSNMVSSTGNLMPVNESEFGFEPAYMGGGGNSNMLGCRNSANLKRSSSFGHNVSYYNQPQSMMGHNGNSGPGGGYGSYMMESPQPQATNLAKSTMNLTYQATQQVQQSEYSGGNITSQLSQSQQMLLTKGLYGAGAEEAAKNLGNLEVTPEMTEKLLLKLLLQQISAQKQQPNGLPSGLQASQILQQLQSHHQQQQQQQQSAQKNSALNSGSNKTSSINSSKSSTNVPSPAMSSKWAHGQPHLTTVQQAKQIFSNSNYNNLLSASNADPSTSPLPAQAASLSTSSSSSSTVAHNNNNNNNNGKGQPVPTSHSSCSSHNSTNAPTKSNHVNQIKNKLLQKSTNTSNYSSEMDGNENMIKSRSKYIDMPASALKNIKQQLQKQQQQQQQQQQSQPHTPLHHHHHHQQQMQQQQQQQQQSHRALEKAAKAKNVSFTSR